jgi:regulator of sigma E protease
LLDFIWNTAAFIIALSILVAIHEFGHFWVARLCHVKVHRFSIGFGKVLFKKIDKKGTEFVIAAIPLGGYVKMLDGRVEDVPEELAEFSFDKKTVWQRIAIVAAGPIANFLLAIFAFFLMYMIGVNSAKPIINNVLVNTPVSVVTEKQPFQITSINGEAVNDWEAVNLALVEQIGEPEFELGIMPIMGDNSQLALNNAEPKQHYTVPLSNWQYDPKKQSIINSLGFVPFSPEVHLIVASVADDSAAKRSGLLVGDKLIAVDGVNLVDWLQFVEIIQHSANKSLQLSLLREGGIQTVSLVPDAREVGDNIMQGYVGLSPKVDVYPKEYLVELQYGIFESLSKALDKSWQLSELTVSTLVKLVTGDLSIKNLSGTVGIAKGAGMSADYGIAYFLGFIALISINLGIMNLIPLPVLDGGHLMYYFFEALTGKPVPEKVQEFGFKIGAAILMTFMSIAILNDFNLL